MYMLIFRLYSSQNIALSYLVRRNFVLERYYFRLRNLSNANKSYSCSRLQMNLKIRIFSKIALKKVSRSSQKGIA